jgi:hypothetical protein
VTEPTAEQVAKLPKWAQEYIRNLVRALEISQRAPLPKSDETAIRPLSDSEGSKFARNPLTFGTYVDCSYEHVFLQDADYLDWLADRGIELNRWLK